MSDNQSEEKQQAPALPASVCPDVTAALLASRELAPPTRPGLLGRLDHYEVLRLLGAGGMGVVFLARDTSSGGEVALKLLKPKCVTQARVVHRFLTEARHLQKLRHPNLAPVLEVVERKEGPYFVMPYFASGSLAGALQSGAALAPERALAIAADIAEALAFIHRRGLIHRDVKPGNILLDANGRALLADFGLARTLFNDSILDVEQAACEGTAPYMSPAVAAGEAEDTRCDIYALGAVLYETLTGRPPYQGATTAEIRKGILAGPPPRIGQVNPKADAGLGRVAEWAMGREHRDRYADVADLLADLRRIERGRAPAGPHRMGLDLRAWGQWLAHQPKWRQAVAGAAVALALAFTLWPHTRLRVVQTFSSQHVSTWLTAQTGDWNGDCAAEILITENNNLYVFSAQGRLLNRVPFDEPETMSVYVQGVEDVNGDGLADAWVSWITSDTNLHLSVVTQGGVRVKTFDARGHVRHAKSRTTASELRPVGLMRGKAGAVERFVAMVTTGYGGNPRGIYCYDYASQKLLWQYLVGPSVLDPVLLDLDGDGLEEVVFGSNACDNHNVGPDGSDDSHSYLFVLSHDGRLLWRTNLTDFFASTKLVTADINGGGKKGIVAWSQTAEPEHRTNRWDVGRVYAFDRDGNAIAHYEAGACLWHRALVLDLDGDGQDKVLLTDCQGNAHVLGRGLRLARTVNVVPKRYQSVELSLLGTARLNRGQGRQIVARSVQWDPLTEQNIAGDPSELYDRFDLHDLRILVLDSTLRVVATHLVTAKWAREFFWAVRVADVDGDGLDEILLLTDRVEVLKLK